MGLFDLPPGEKADLKKDLRTYIGGKQNTVSLERRRNLFTVIVKKVAIKEIKKRNARKIKYYRDYIFTVVNQFSS
jgi:hypothetical protein